MHLRKGDKVKFLNDTGGGIISEIVDSKTAKVLTDDGFEVPVPLAELIVISETGNSDSSGERHPGNKGRALNKEQEHMEEYDERTDVPDYPTDPLHGNKVNVTGFGEDNNDLDYYAGKDRTGYQKDERPGRVTPERNLFFGFVQASDKDEVDAWLINDSIFNVFYTVLLRQDASYITLKAGLIEADTRIFIRDFSRDEVNSFLTFRVQALFYIKGLFEPVAPSQKELRIDPVELSGSDFYAANDFFEEDAVIIPLISDYDEREKRLISEKEIKRLIDEKKGAGKHETREKVKKDPLVEEVDLHIEELTDDPGRLSGREVLDMQMARFTTALEGALRGKTRRIVFIHGVGNGKLKFEIRKTLDKKYPRLKYQDASFREYGYGATMVIVRK